MQVKNFAIIDGNADIKDGKIKYKYLINEGGGLIDKSLSPKIYRDERQFLLVRSDINFNSGILQFKINLKTLKTGIYLILKSENGSDILCGTSYTDQRFVIAQEGNFSWKDLSSAGNLQNYEINTNILYEIRVIGSTVKLLVNKIALCEANVSIKDSPIEFRISSKKDFEVYDIQIEQSKPKVFVIMQFSDDYNQLYDEVIKPIVETFNYECIRSDEFSSSNPILKDIVDTILGSKAVIAEITPDNPNVFYEIGYSHAIGKPTILLCGKNRAKLPFDLSGFRTLFYENTIAGKKKIEDSLRQYLNNI